MDIIISNTSQKIIYWLASIWLSRPHYGKRTFGILQDLKGINMSFNLVRVSTTLSTLLCACFLDKHIHPVIKPQLMTSEIPLVNTCRMVKVSLLRLLSCAHMSGQTLSLVACLPICHVCVRLEIVVVNKAMFSLLIHNR